MITMANRDGNTTNHYGYDRWGGRGAGRQDRDGRAVMQPGMLRYLSLSHTNIRRDNTRNALLVVAAERVSPLLVSVADAKQLVSQSPFGFQDYPNCVSSHVNVEIFNGTG